MNGSEKISEAIGLLDEDIIEEANARRVPEKKSGISLWMKIASAAACLAIIIAAVAIVPKDSATGGDLLTITGTAASTAGRHVITGVTDGEAVTSPAAGGVVGTEDTDTRITVPAGGTADPPETTEGNGGDDVTEVTDGTPAAQVSEPPESFVPSYTPPAIPKTAERVPVVIPDGRELVEISENVSPLAVAAYPKTAKYPDENSFWKADGTFDAESYTQAFNIWNEDGHKRRDAGREVKTPNEFYKISAAEFLSDSAGRNRVYSPVNTYMALAMLAETTGGESRYQILDLLGEKDIASLRSQAKNIWNATYRSDGAAWTTLANSLWLDGKLNYDPDTVNELAENYLASVYGGDLSSPEVQNALKNWIDEQTGGLLKDSVNALELPPETLMTLCSTVYFRAKWENEFDPNKNDTKIFHGRNGDKETVFMNGTDEYKGYFRGKDFGAIELYFSEAGKMWLILPDENSSVDNVLISGEYLEMISKGWEWKDITELKINYSVPKFDVSSDIDLADGLKMLGVTDVFDEASADFSPLTNDTVYLDKAQHSARVKIDEEGCSAAAFTVMGMCGAGMPPEVDEIDFILDRPFIFVITSDTDQPLFIGTVNQL